MRIRVQSPVLPKKKKKGNRDGGWHRPVIPALRRLRQEGCEFEDSLGYICLQKEKNNGGETTM
jgi:hypothetical protein